MIAIRDNETLAECARHSDLELQARSSSPSARPLPASVAVSTPIISRSVSPLTFQMFYSTTILIIVLGGGAGSIRGVVVGSIRLRRRLRGAAHLARIPHGDVRPRTAVAGILVAQWPARRSSTAGSRCCRDREMTSLSPALGKPLLAVRGLRKSYGAVQAVQWYRLRQSGRRALLPHGPNGSGKSTFFDCVHRPAAGRRGHGPSRRASTSPAGRCNRIAHEGKMLRSFQKTVVFTTMTPEENLIAAGQMFAFPEPALDLLARSGLAPSSCTASGAGQRSDRDGRPVACTSHQMPAGNLSGGQQKLLQFASMLMPEPKADPAGRAARRHQPNADRAYRREHPQCANQELGVTFIVIEHNIDAIMSFCASAWSCWTRARSSTEDEPEAIMRNQKVVEAYLGG